MRNILLAHCQRALVAPLISIKKNKEEYEHMTLVHEVNDIIAPICIFNSAPC